MAALAVVVTAAMIRCVPFVAWFRTLFCEVCGDSVMHVTESGDQLCGSCLVDRRTAWRKQRLAAAKAAGFPAERKAEQDRANARRKEAALLRDFEGDVAAVDLARDGYFDEFYGEWSGSEVVGPKPRWIEEPTHRENRGLKASPNTLARAVFALTVAVMFPTIRANALANAKIQLAEIWRVDDGHQDVTTMYDGTDDRDMGSDVLAWLKRDPSNKAILNRWFRPDDELEFMDRLREEGREAEWWELMVDFRRRKLDGLLKEYFGLDDYRASMIVLKWEKGASGRWKPAKQMNVVDWVKWSCEQSGSTLGGLQSCTRSIQVKTQLRKRKEAKRLHQEYGMDAIEERENARHEARLKEQAGR